MDFTKYFVKYENLVKQVDDAFRKVENEFNNEVNCSNGCSECCHAIFDLTFVEALYLKTKFNDLYTGKIKHEIITEANATDRKIYKLKKKIAQESKSEQAHIEIIGKLSREKVKCPLLNKENKCMMYDNRPVACRVSGIPSSSNGFSHICGLSGFDKGEKYPTLNMDVVYKQLYKISTDLVKDINSKHSKMGDILTPVSMALLTDYNEDYLGIDSNLQIIG